MRTRWLLAGMLASAMVSAEQPEQRWVILPTSQVSGVRTWYSNQGPKRVTGTWEPTETEIGELNASLDQIRDLSHRSYEKSRWIEDPESYFRQYLGIIQKGRQRIYVSAYCGIHDGAPAYWRQHLFMIDDGGRCVWQALYDVQSKTFVELRVNGFA